MTDFFEDLCTKGLVVGDECSPWYCRLHNHRMLRADGRALTSLLPDVDPISRASRREAGLMVSGTKLNEGVSGNWY